MNDNKTERLEHANTLIRIISEHGRRFFMHTPKNGETRIARLELRGGKVYFVDDYSQKSVYTHKTAIPSRWKGFTHGGTLRSLVEDMRDYIVKGRPIPRWKIVIRQLGSEGLENNVWGYDEKSAEKVRELAYALPIVEPLGMDNP